MWVSPVQPSPHLALTDLICQCVIHVSCYQNYTRNTQTALVSTLLPVSYTLLCHAGRRCPRKLDRRGRDVELHRRARCDGSSAPCSGGPRISAHGCAAGAEAAAHVAWTDPDFFRTYLATVLRCLRASAACGHGARCCCSRRFWRRSGATGACRVWCSYHYGVGSSARRRVGVQHRGDHVVSYVQ